MAAGLVVPHIAARSIHHGGWVWGKVATMWQLGEKLHCRVTFSLSDRCHSTTEGHPARSDRRHSTTERHPARSDRTLFLLQRDTQLDTS